MNNFIKVLILLIPCAIVHGIQVYENVTNDITTATTKLVIVPTPIAKNEGDANDTVTSSNMDTKDQNNQLMNNSSSIIVSQEKNSRKKENENKPDGRNIIKVEQQEKTSSNVKHEKFVPSPEISLGGIEIPERPILQTNDNFYPINQYYRPPKQSLHFHSSSPIISNSNWKHSPNFDSLQKNYPKFENEVQQNKENQKFTFPPSSHDNQWHIMPDKPPVEISEKPKAGGKWKWVSDDEEQDKITPISYNPISPSSIPSIPSNDFSYAFEIPSTDSTPYSFGSTKYDGFDQQPHIDSLSTTLSTLDSEWESPFTSSNGKLKHKSKGNGKRSNISPWKKILHVLTAAIPIGLLISALTPQVIYVDPNSTSSISPSNSLNLLSTSKHRSLDGGPIQLPDLNNIAENGRKFMSNPLMDFLHVLRDNNNSMERTDSCDDRKFCEASRAGADANATVLNKMLWKIANETPELQAKKSGLDHIFQAIRNNNCSIFECKKQEMNYHRQNYRKN